MVPGTFTAAILAGGQARRLGGADKGALSIGTQSILDRQLTLLRGLTPHILIVSNDAARFRRVGVPVVADRMPGIGALGGLHTALAEAPTEQVMVVACDMPFITAPLVGLLLAVRGDADAAMPRDAHGRHPLCACYARRIAGHLEACIDGGMRRVLDAVASLSVREVSADELSRIDPAGRVLMNVNTPHDVMRARTTAAASLSEG